MLNVKMNERENEKRIKRINESCYRTVEKNKFK